MITAITAQQARNALCVNYPLEILEISFESLPYWDDVNAATCQIWKWYTIGDKWFVSSEKLGK